MCQLHQRASGSSNVSSNRGDDVPGKQNDMETTVVRPDSQSATRSARFPFGRNWASFLGVLTEARIQEAERSLRAMLGAERLAGAAFLDAGSGSGLFSLAAMRLGARRVHSFDFD